MEVDGVSVEDDEGEMSDDNCAIKVKIVCNGSSGSHDSIHSGVGSKIPGA